MRERRVLSLASLAALGAPPFATAAEAWRANESNDTRRSYGFRLSRRYRGVRHLRECYRRFL